MSHPEISEYGFKICDSTYRRVPVVGRLDFELWGDKVKISQNIVPKSILRFYILWDLQYLIFKLLEGVFSCKNCPLNFKNTNTLCRFTDFKNLFLKINISPICYDILNKIAISQKSNVGFQNCLHQNIDERTANYEITKCQFWSSETTGPFLCVETQLADIVATITISFVFTKFRLQALSAHRRSLRPQRRVRPSTNPMRALKSHQAVVGDYTEVKMELAEIETKTKENCKCSSTK